MISVIMSIYNEPEDWIKSSINSILDQTFRDFEFIIVNDNPFKKSNSLILKTYAAKDERIVIIKNNENLGLTKSLNIALGMVTRKYIARMDADDISMIDRFEKQFDFMESNSNYVLCGTSRINFNGRKEEIVILPSSDNEIKIEMLLGNRITHPTAMIRTKTIKENNLKYDENIKKSQDYNLWLRMSHLGKFKNIEKPLLKYRLSNNQISNLNYSNQYYYSSLNRKLYIKKYFKNLNIDITQKKSFNEILSLNAPSNIKEIYLSSYMIFNVKHEIKVYIRFIFRFNFFLFFRVHKFYLVDLINTIKLNVKE